MSSSDAWRALNSSPVRSPRLRLRFMREGDGRFLAAAYRRNRDWLEPWEPIRPESFFGVPFQERAARAARDEALNDRGYRFLAFERGEAESLESFAGMIAVANIARGVFQCATLGYWIAGGKAGQGFGREMVGAAVDWAFERSKLHRVQAAIQPENEASRRLVEALGFRNEGRALRYLKIAGEWRDHDIFAKTAEEHDIRASKPWREPRGV